MGLILQRLERPPTWLLNGCRVTIASAFLKLGFCLRLTRGLIFNRIALAATMTVNTLRALCQSILLWSPLAAIPWMLNLRWTDLSEPNEAPKWVVFTLSGEAIALAGALLNHLNCFKPARQHQNPRLAPRWSALAVWLFLIGVGLGVIYAANFGAAMNRWAFWCCAALVAWAVAVSAREYPEKLFTRLQWSLTLSAMILCISFWHGFFYDFGRQDFDNLVFFSRIGHFNYTADTMVLLIPLLVWTLLTGGGFLLKSLAAATLISCTFMVVTSGSLGGMGGLLGGGVFTAALGITARLNRSSPRDLVGSRLKPRVLGYALLIIVVLGSVASAIYPHIPKHYRDQILSRAEWWSAPKSNAMDTAKHLPPLTPLWLAITPYLGARTPMWASTAGMIAEHPWRGSGTGSYLFEYPAFEKRYDLFKDPETLGNQIRTDPHNVLLWVAAENGLPLMLLFAGLFVWLLLAVTRQAWRTPNAFWLCGAWALWAAGLDAQVNQVFFSPASLFMMALSIGLWYGSLPNSADGRTIDRCALWGNPISLMLCWAAALWLASYPITWLISEYHVSEARRLESSQPRPSYRQILLSWVNARRWSPTNANALYGLANEAFGQGHFASAESYLNAFLKLAPYHTPGLNLLANLQMKTKRFDEAEKTLERALQVEPDAKALRENLEVLRKNSAQPAVAPTSGNETKKELIPPKPEGDGKVSQ